MAFDFGEYGREKSDNIKADYFLTIGVERTNEAGEVEFITLPQPLGIDTMKKREVNGTGEFQEKLLTGNDLLEDLIAFAKKNLNPGDQRMMVGFKVMLNRRKTNQSSTHQKVNFNFELA